MADYFVDTSFWIALIDNRDQFHSGAVVLSNEISGSLITTRSVLIETATHSHVRVGVPMLWR